MRAWGVYVWKRQVEWKRSKGRKVKFQCQNTCVHFFLLASRAEEIIKSREERRASIYIQNTLSSWGITCRWNQLSMTKHVGQEPLSHAHNIDATKSGACVPGRAAAYAHKARASSVGRSKKKKRLALTLNCCRQVNTGSMRCSLRWILMAFALIDTIARNAFSSSHFVVRLRHKCLYV